MAQFDRYIGLPYQNLGRSFSGVDCFGLVYIVYNELGITLPDFTELQYPQDWYKNSENYILDNIWGDWVEVNPPYQIFDALLFYNSSRRVVVNHIGVYINDDKFLHIMEGATSQISRLTGYWESKLYKGLRSKSVQSNI